MSDRESVAIDLAEIAVIIIEECSGISRPDPDPVFCLDSLEDDDVRDHALDAGRRILRYIARCIPGAQLVEGDDWGTA